MGLTYRAFLLLMFAATVCEARLFTAGGGGPLNLPLVDNICGITLYRDVCTQSLNNAGQITDPKEMIRMSFKVAQDQIVKGIQESKTINEAKQDNETAQALEICRQVMEYSSNDLERTINSTTEFRMNNLDAFIEDLKVWIGGAITYQDVCFDAFENTSTEAGQKIRQFFGLSRELSSNALNIVSDFKELIGKFNIPVAQDLTNHIGNLLGGGPGMGIGMGRRLLGQAWVAGEPPAWAANPRRRVMGVPVQEIKPDAVVALDGSGQFKTIGEAVAMVPPKSEEPFIIYIKAGVYRENVLVPKQAWNVIFIGDGNEQTIITGNKNYKEGVKTFNTATVGVDGDGFMARDIKFENTAGPDGEQAVALRVASDLAIFHNCRMDGAQDTLYSMRGRQFYRDCIITGTVDFIFGDAQAVYQNCRILINQPRLHQDCEVTAQGRTEPNGPGGFVIQGSRIEATEGYRTFQNSPGKSAYLGRPWKEFSRTIIMNSFIDGVISPEGWHPWPGSNANVTAFYVEYQNQGPGANTAMRVKWPAIKTLSAADVEQFTPARLFMNPDAWIPNTGVPFAAGVFSV